MKRDLTFAAAVEETEIGKMAEKDAAQFHGANTMPAEVPQIPKKGIRVRCYRCDGAHDARECWVTQEQCRYCEKRGHIERACRAKHKDQGEERPCGDQRDERPREDQRGDKRGNHRGERSQVKPLRRNKIKEVAFQEQPGSEDEREVPVNWQNIHMLGMEQWQSQKPLFVTVEVEGRPLKMELDTGAAVSLMPYSVYRNQYKDLLLKNTQIKLKTYTGERISPRGHCEEGEDLRSIVPLSHGRESTTVDGERLVVESPYQLAPHQQDRQPYCSKNGNLENDKVDHKKIPSNHAGHHWNYG